MASFRSYASLPCTYRRHSRNLLAQPHCDPSGLDTLTTGYHTLLSFVLSTWSSKPALSQSQFIDFVKSVVDSLPSSSSQQSSSRVATVGDHLVDMIWSVDAALDEVLSDAKLILSTGNTVSTVVAEKAKVTKQNAEKDKEGLQALVKRLLVCATLCSTAFETNQLTGAPYRHSRVLPGALGPQRVGRCGAHIRREYDGKERDSNEDRTFVRACR